MSSRWASNPSEDAEVAAQRKKQKEEKRKVKEEKQRQIDAEKSAAEARQAQQVQCEEAERPSKRQRTSPPGQQVHSEGAHILDFPSTNFGASRSLSLYEILNPIEEGSYGFVSRARLRSSGDIVALKKLKLDQTANIEGFPVTALREIQTLKASLPHPHIVNLREIIIGEASRIQDASVYLVMDFIEHDLKSLLEDLSEPFLPSEIKTLMLQLCSAVSFLHDNWIMHRDLKTSNLLLNNRGELKIADFGMARYTANPPPRLTQLVVTLWYRAPEILLGASEYSFEIDVWSLGCIFAELLTGDPPFQGRNEVTQLSAIFNLLGTPTTDSWPGFRSLPNAKALHPVLSNNKPNKSNLSATRFPYLTSTGLRLLSSMLSLNPDRRPTASKILLHQYFQEDPCPKPKEMFPTFPSKAGGEKRRRKATPQAPDRGDAPRLKAEDFAKIFERGEEQQGAGFALRMG